MDEFLKASNSKESKEELADVQEVIDYLKVTLNMKDSDFEKFKKKKEKKAGGFKKRIYLESVGIQDDSEWVDYFLKNSDRYPEIKKPA